MTDNKHILSVENAIVFVVDDSTESFVTIGRLLEAAGIDSKRYYWRSNSYDAYEDFALIAPHIDLVLIDLSLTGGEDGYELLAALKAKNLVGTRFVAVTGRVSIEEMRRCQAAGFDGFLAKPLNGKVFPEQLAHILAGESIWAYD